jgi:hypothetical protein
VLARTCPNSSPSPCPGSDGANESCFTEGTPDGLAAGRLDAVGTMNPLDGEADDFSKMLGLCIGAALVRFVGSSTEGCKERYVWDPEGLVVGFDIGRRDGGAEGRLVDGRGVGGEGGLL